MNNLKIFFTFYFEVNFVEIQLGIQLFICYGNIIHIISTISKFYV